MQVKVAKAAGTWLDGSISNTGQRWCAVSDQAEVTVVLRVEWTLAPVEG